jgi:hypothetical protein
MADNVPHIPTGAIPPKKETGKVQPKKETVRINLPPKPSAAPTIKLPTLPPGGPTGAAPQPGAAPAGAPAPAHPTHATAAAPAIPRTTTAAPIAQRPGVVAPRGVAPAAAAPTLSSLDTFLAIAAAVIGLLAVASTVYVAFMLGS